MPKYKEFPKEFSTLIINKDLTLPEILLVEQGKIPRDMDSRWYIYFDKPWLNFYRSWTGYLIYKARIVQDDGVWSIKEVLINNDQEQYKYTNKSEEKELFLELFGYFLQGIL